MERPLSRGVSTHLPKLLQVLLEEEEAEGELMSTHVQCMCLCSKPYSEPAMRRKHIPRGEKHSHSRPGVDRKVSNSGHYDSGQIILIPAGLRVFNCKVE